MFAEPVGSLEEGESSAGKQPGTSSFPDFEERLFWHLGFWPQ